MTLAQGEEELAPEAGGRPQPAHTVVAQWEEANACAKLAGAFIGKPRALLHDSKSCLIGLCLPSEDSHLSMRGNSPANEAWPVACAEPMAKEPSCSPEGLMHDLPFWVIPGNAGSWQVRPLKVPANWSSVRVSVLQCNPIQNDDALLPVPPAERGTLCWSGPGPLQHRAAAVGTGVPRHAAEQQEP